MTIRLPDQQSHLELNEHELSELSRDLLMSSVLQELALSLPAINDRRQLLDESASSAAMLLDAPQAVVLLLINDGLALEVAASYSAAGDDLRPPQQIRTGRGLLGCCALYGRPVLTNGAGDDQRFDRASDRIGGVQIDSVLAVPLMIRDRIVGVLAVSNRDRAFSNHELRWITTLGSIISAAYENLLLIERLRGEQERLLEAQEELRKKLARDLHDGATQDIAAAQMQVEYMRRLLQHDPAKLESEMDYLSSLLGRAVRQLRTALFDLRPLILESQGLVAALRRYVEEHRSDRKPHLELQIVGTIPPLKDRAGGALFAIVQEAVNNARKHAQANEIIISVACLGEQLIVGVCDDGKGFDINAVTDGYEDRTSFGMHNMNELVTALGAALALWSEPNKGTSITVSVPLSQLEGRLE